MLHNIYNFRPKVTWIPQKGLETTEHEDDLFPKKTDHPLLNRQRAYHQQKLEERENEKREKYESGTVS